jgi:hypothetical protein
LGDANRRRWIVGALGVAGSEAAMPLSGCVDQTPVREAVLKPGESVTATNKFGTVTIAYVSERKRKFELDGHTAVRKLIVRPQRFMGMLGLYDPAEAWAFAPPEYRLLFEEAQQFFGSYDEIYAKLYEGSDIMDWVYTPDGLVVGYGLARSKEPGQINTYEVNLFQYYLNGAKPTGLRGSRADKIGLRRT